jgi:hypothetical protein
MMVMLIITGVKYQIASAGYPSMVFQITDITHST